MNFLTSAFGTLTGTSIPYTLKDKIVDASTDSSSIWSIYNATNPKNENAEVTVFEFNLKDAGALRRGYEPLARNAFKKLKLVKYPGILRTVDYIESDSYLYIVTEAVVPLITYMQSQSTKSEAYKLFGIHAISAAMQFINTTCKCLHGNLNIFDSVFVTRLGDWRLFGFELLTNLTSDPDQPVYRLSGSAPQFSTAAPPEVTSQGIEAIRSFPLKLDSYRLAAFIHLVLVTKDFSQVNSPDMLSMQGISAKLASPLKKLGSIKPTLRCTIEKFNQETSTFFESTPVVRFDAALKDIKFNGTEEQRLNFYKHELAQFVGDRDQALYPSGFLDYKLLPELIEQYKNTKKAKSVAATGPVSPEEMQQRQETVLVLLGYIIQFGIALDQARFRQIVTPIIVDAFLMSDRQVRLLLLTHLKSYEHFLTDLEVQQNIFYPLVTGFHDTNFTIRENTLTSITVIIDKVSVKQVNQDLLKLLAKSQVDPKPSIRVNTLILVIRISSKIYKLSRNNVLITALSKALRDSFVPCKMKALEGFENLRDGFSLEEICSKVLGHLAISLMDPKSAKVRLAAKRIFQLYLALVEEHALSLPDNAEADDKEEQEFFQRVSVTNQSMLPPALLDPALESTFASGWRIMNKLVSLQVNGVMNKDLDTPTPDISRVGTPTIAPLKTMSSAPQVPTVSSWKNHDDDADADDGWGLEQEEEVVPIKPVKPIIKPTLRSNMSAQRVQVKSLATSKRLGGLQIGKVSQPKKSPVQINLDIGKDVDEDDAPDAWGFDDKW